MGGTRKAKSVAAFRALRWQFGRDELTVLPKSATDGAYERDRTRGSSSLPSACRLLTYRFQTLYHSCWVKLVKQLYRKLHCSMTHHLSKLLLIGTLALVSPIWARDNYSIRHALARQDYGSALALTRHEFASVRSGGEAANLIHVIVASAPAEQIAPLVTAAVEANQQYGPEIIQAAIEGASPAERAAIVSSVYFVLKQNPNTPAPLLNYVSGLVNSARVPSHSVLTTPWFNTGASVGTLK
jgi:hypothetical protein